MIEIGFSRIGLIAGVGIATLLLVVPPPAVAQGVALDPDRYALESRVAELEAAVRALEGDRRFKSNSAVNSDSDSPGESPTTAGTSADLARRLSELEWHLRQRDTLERQAANAADQRFRIRPFGRIHLDTVMFNQDDANKATVGNAVNGVDIRRARLGVEGEGFGTYFYRFDVDFVAFDGTHATRPTIFDAYLDIQQLPVLGNLRVGHFREPFSMERLESSHDFAFLERSIAINTLTPFRNVGLMAFDWNESETRTWSYGVFHENTDEYGASVRDSNPMAVTGRTTWLPFVDDNLDVPRLLHVGASYSYRRLNPASRQFQQTPEAIVRRALIAAPSFVDTGVISLENYHVAGVEFAAMKAAFALQGELVWLTGQGTTSDPVMFHGGYLEAMYWLSGENRNYNRKLGIHGAVQPNCNFLCRETTDGVCCGGGAWEVAARVSYLNLNSGSIQGGALTDMTFGLNWYYAVRSRVMFNYIHAFLDRSSLRSHADIFSVRFQFTF